MPLPTNDDHNQPQPPPKGAQHLGNDTGDNHDDRPPLVNDRLPTSGDDHHPPRSTMRANHHQPKRPPRLTSDEDTGDDEDMGDDEDTGDDELR